MRKIAMAATLGLNLFPLMSCETSAGAEGGPCHHQGDISQGQYYCDGNLVCNTQVANTCEQPNAHGLGGPCGISDNCTTDLFCSAFICAPRRKDGQTCDAGACVIGLECPPWKPAATPTSRVCGPGGSHDAATSGSHDAGSRDGKTD